LPATAVEIGTDSKTAALARAVPAATGAILTLSKTPKKTFEPAATAGAIGADPADPVTNEVEPDEAKLVLAAATVAAVIEVPPDWAGLMRSGA
jgi:hypothetical protein